MELANIRTRQDLITFLVETGRANEPTAAETTEWFILCASARDLLDVIRVKDFADMLRVGIVPFDPEKDIDNYINTIFEEVDQARKDGDELLATEQEEWAIAGLMEHITDHFGR